MPDQMSLHDIDEIGFQRKEWMVQRVAWGVMAVVVLAALAGFFGAGPVSHTTTETADGSLEIEYDRFVRHEARSSMELSVSPSAVQDGKATLYLSRALVDRWRVEHVTPAPSTESSSSDWVILEYEVLGTTTPRIELHYRGDGLGRAEGSIRVGEDGEQLEVSQWIHP